MNKFFFIKILLCLFLLIISPTQCKVNADSNNFYYTYNVEHLFTHCLIAYPELAFKNDNTMKKHYDTDCITSLEFKKILKNLYVNNYVLVSINSCFEIKEGIAVKKKIKVPLNKKPLILSFDDVNYDQTKLGKGMVDKIVIDKNGNLASSTNFNGNLHIEYDKEFIPILEDFVNDFPDFSLNGAKGLICLTGYDGILGYRTSHTNNKNLKEETQNAKKVIHKLKQNGWDFACHSYGHYHMKKITLNKFKQELIRWNDEVKPLIAETKIYVYPYGEWEVFNNNVLSEKHQLLNDYGFKLFCGVGMKSFYSYLPNKNNIKVLFMDRKCIDGRTLKLNHSELHKFFNPTQILDIARNYITS